MKILHTADLHLGQVIYQNYDRSDEHQHFFRQLERWCQKEQPDALLVSGDVFDIQQPSATVKKAFTDYFVRLHRVCPQMTIVITAGNHDSASRIQADNAVWQLANAYLIGTSPAYNCLDLPDGWQYQYIIKLESGYIVALPYMTGERQQTVQSLLDKVAEDNTLGLPVVVMGHQAVTGADATGHDFEIGKLKTQEVGTFGTGFDYLALGHIHKPQTIGHQDDCMEAAVDYHSPVVRYSGSALHVSCDEKYPHSVSLVEIDRHGGSVTLTRLRIDEELHFYELPDTGAAATAEEALESVRRFVAERGEGYFRLVMDYHAALPADFNQQVYQLIEPCGGRVRFNPKTVWVNVDSEAVKEDRPLFDVPDLQQMADPMEFIRKTQANYPELDIDELTDAFKEVEAELRRQAEEPNNKNHED